MSGELQFTLTEAKRYEQIQINLSGGAKVKWIEQYTNASGNQETVTYSSAETYVNETKILWESRQTPDGKIGPGKFSLPFQFILPSNCQSTMKCPMDYGSISYALHAKIITGQFLHFDPTVDLPLKVRRIADINLPDLVLPSHQSEHTLVGWCCCSAGELQLTADLARSGCCIGHKFPLTVNVDNNSSRKIKIRARIERKYTFIASGHQIEYSKRIVGVYSPEIDRYSQYTWNANNLIVPAHATATIEGSEIIKMEDSLHVTAIIPWDCNSNSVTFPIKLGNVPLMD